jgi:hypothetical protein
MKTLVFLFIAAFRRWLEYISFQLGSQGVCATLQLFGLKYHLLQEKYSDSIPREI